jgi:hypothetical protein
VQAWSAITDSTHVGLEREMYVPRGATRRVRYLDRECVLAELGLKRR